MEPTATNDVLDPVERMPQEKLKDLQHKRLQNLLPKVYENSPLIRDLWDNAGVSPLQTCTMDDFFRRAPFMNKDTIREFRDQHDDPMGGFVRMDEPGLKGVYTTSGTTGDPTPLPRGYRSPFETGFARDHWHFGVRPGDYILQFAFTFRSGSKYQASRMLGVKPICLSHGPDMIPRMIEALDRFKPTLLNFLSSPMLIALERYFEETGLDPVKVFAPLKSLIYGGEPLSPRHRKMLKSWDVDVFQNGPLGDVCSASTCRAHDGFHGYEDLALIECLEPFGDQPVADGEIGEMVVTTLCEPFVPLIRFRTDYLCTIDRSPCACGRTHLKFKILGRKGDQTFVQGISILPQDIRMIIEEHKPTRSGLFQIIRPSPQLEILSLRVGYAPDFVEGGLDALNRALGAVIEQALGVPVKLDMVSEQELLKLGPPHKIPRVTKQ